MTVCSTFRYILLLLVFLHFVLQTYLFLILTCFLISDSVSMGHQKVFVLLIQDKVFSYQLHLTFYNFHIKLYIAWLPLLFQFIFFKFLSFISITSKFKNRKIFLDEVIVYMHFYQHRLKFLCSWDFSYLLGFFLRGKNLFREVSPPRWYLPTL